ncbi:hypothetical protein MIND_01233500 [Mycena indigotica]|uniref:Uncharacterized protein n=1 Tax=Mycena indigotica TaxID=2126181 RepID=A0A8H6S4A7_9AGAR|nr:uncharacterized protein MIND_01233500 [Mycena indigotica]KAF7292073.1 hypothetical protein MIND_01233500 [Mycena indigotica]
MNVDPLLAEVLQLAASWVNVGLYTLEVVLVVGYFRKRPTRPFYRAAVSAMLLFDTVCTLDVCVHVCFRIMGLSEDAQLVPNAISVFMTYATATAEEIVMCYVFYTLTHNLFLLLVLGTLIVGHLSLALVSGSLMLVRSSMALRVASASSVTCASTDLAIAGCLAFKVWKLMGSAHLLDSRFSLARRFFLLVISSGLLVATNTLLMTGLLLTRNPAFSFFYSCQGRVYALTLLGNFLVGIPFRASSPGSAAQELDLSRSMGLRIASGILGTHDRRHTTGGNHTSGATGMGEVNSGSLYYSRWVKEQCKEADMPSRPRVMSVP